MANNYTQFSFAVPLDTSEEIEWARHTVALLAEHDNGVEITELDVILPDDEDFLGYDAEVDNDGLWIHADESGQPEHVVPLVQEFLRRFRPQGHVGFEWADTCSSPRLDQFGGGACLITVHDAKWMASRTGLRHRSPPCDLPSTRQCVFGWQRALEPGDGPGERCDRSFVEAVPETPGGRCRPALLRT
jgi:hypothetical protein